jgi:hypothetical protein
MYTLSPLRTDCSEGYDDFEDEGDPTQIPRPIFQVGKKF